VEADIKPIKGHSGFDPDPDLSGAILL